jgi:hypothetical protein
LRHDWLFPHTPCHCHLPCCDVAERVLSRVIQCGCHALIF